MSHDFSFLQPIVSQQPYSLLFATVSGAHLYGFPSPDSDYDLRGAHILPIAEVSGLDDPQETIEFSGDSDGIELDLVTHDALKFFKMMLKRNGYVMEQIFSPLVVHTTPEHEELKRIARTCLTRHHVHHYKGFVRTEWDRFEREQPHRVKPLLYTYRILLTGIHLMRSGEVESNLLVLNEMFHLPYVNELVERKSSGENTTLTAVDVEFYRREYERLSVQMEEAAASSTLPEQPLGKPALNDLLLHIRGVK
ncbi:MAG: nucleotidyltransferase [Chloroflexi bacterium]|nr:nucleotidyltransferase [Chloroflexota bacterium]